MASEDYQKQNSTYQECINNFKKNDEAIFSLWLSEANCGHLRPDNRWQQSNEFASQYCSQKADESEDGKLRNQFRKKVPASDLTDNEIKEEIKNKIK